MRADIRLALLTVYTLSAVGSLNAGEWYETLYPGVTRSNVIQLAGEPSSTDVEADYYKQPKGHIACKYSRNALESLIYHDAPSGVASWTLYSTQGEPGKTDVQERRTFLKSGNFVTVPRFGGQSVYTAKYKGKCYEVDGAFIVVEPIVNLLGGRGHFADKVARLLLVGTNGAEKVLYRAAEHWEKLRPPDTSQAEVLTRGRKLRKAGIGVIGTPIKDSLGKSDSFMGSGVDYRLFYLEDALAIVACEHPAQTIASIWVIKPGLADMTLDEWLASANPTLTNTPPSLRPR